MHRTNQKDKQVYCYYSKSVKSRKKNKVKKQNRNIENNNLKKWYNKLKSAIINSFQKFF